MIENRFERWEKALEYITKELAERVPDQDHIHWVQQSQEKSLSLNLNNGNQKDPNWSELIGDGEGSPMRRPPSAKENPKQMEGNQNGIGPGHIPVSYTHLTLPTIYSV
eukprot:TRINITY_DN9626_c0_g2_i5.p1 TRINITY_DN9626_c0_g2~~TRINITY_DN9626_c0_g2_i5.p1  ORF type:complete len:108 (+),score=20.04 TRINITY_DN9626_c0_g2_i5:287-610(+)